LACDPSNIAILGKEKGFRVAARIIFFYATRHGGASFGTQ
jgi:hypothetical protein